MSQPELEGSLLASVSRSFYLTIRLLPPPLRGPIGLAYLLARASDTIADSSDAPPAVRQRHLAAFDAMIRDGHTQGLPDLQREISSPHEGERALLAALDRCLECLARLPASDRHEIAAVLAKIIHGQQLDLERFAAGGAIVALPTAAALEEYTYLVAGCVGEFWTRICTQHLPRYSALDPAELIRLGTNYGQGLQLVNILRDLPADLRTGRCYLPADELAAAGIPLEALLHAPATARPVFQHWLHRAHEFLDDGFRYIEAIRPARVRAGCFLPWHLGRATLRLMDLHPPLETSQKVKVPRSAVRSALLLALPVSLSNRALHLIAKPAAIAPLASSQFRGEAP